MICRACRFPSTSRLISSTRSQNPVQSTIFAQTTVRPRAHHSSLASRTPSQSQYLRPSFVSNAISARNRPLSAPFSSSSSSSSSSSNTSSATTESAESPTQTTVLEKPDYLDAAESWIWDKLVAEFEPQELVVRDVSGGCGSMYAIDITSDRFRGANMLKQQRMVNKVLGEQVKQWHGMQLRTKAP